MSGKKPGPLAIGAVLSALLVVASAGYGVWKGALR
jgi:hypothetical protein